MHAQVIHDQEHLLRRPGDQARQEHDEQGGVHLALVDHPSHLALVGDRRDHVDAEATAGHTQLGGVLGPGIAAAVLAGRTHPRLIPPVDLGVLLGGTPFDLGVGLVQPLRDFLGVLPVGLANGLLRRVPPAAQVFAHGADRQPLAGLLLDQLLNGRAGPQGRGDAHLLRSLAVDEVDQGQFLFLAEQPPGGNRATGARARKGRLPALLVADAPAGNGLLPQAEDGGNIDDRVAEFASVDGTPPQGLEDFIGLRPPIRQFDRHGPTPSLRYSQRTEHGATLLSFTIGVLWPTARSLHPLIIFLAGLIPPWRIPFCIQSLLPRVKQLSTTVFLPCLHQWSRLPLPGPPMSYPPCAPWIFPKSSAKILHSARASPGVSTFRLYRLRQFEGYASARFAAPPPAHVDPTAGI